MTEEEEEDESCILDGLHRCISILLDAADREVDGGLNTRGDQELTGSKKGRKGKIRKNLSSSLHGSSFGQNRRSVRSNSPMSARQENSLSTSLAPDMDSWKDFPPIGAQGHGPTPEPVLRTVQNRSSKKKARRITPTPVGLQTSFSSSFSTSGSGAWAVNPAFASNSLHTPSSHSQRADRQLLQEQLQRKQKTLGATPLTTTSQDSAPPTSMSQESAPPTSANQDNVLPPDGNHDHAPPTSVSQESAPPTSMSEESAPPTWQVQGSPLLLPRSDTNELSHSSVADESLSCGPRSTASPAVEVALSDSTVTHRANLDTLAAKYTSSLLRGRVVNIASELQSVIRLLILQSSAWRVETQAKTASQLPLRSVTDASYFAVAVLERCKELLYMLQRETLRLLSCNSRVAEFGRELKTWLHQVISEEEVEEEGEDDREAEGSVSLVASDTSLGVMFNVETDSKKNFPTDRAFHAFKKQRDSFYELYRYWRLHGDQMDDNDFAGRTRMVLRSCDSHVTQGHLARLFLQQLLKSCRPQGVGPSVEESVAERLKQTDLGKLQKLTQRFTSPMKHGRDRHRQQNDCHFVGEEEFFHKFIVLADSYSFNEHLKHCLTSEVKKLNDACLLYSSRREYQCTLGELKLLARFLGLLVYLPYKMAASAHHTSAASSGQYVSKVLGYPLAVVPLLESALQKCQVLLTVPWVMEYLVAMGGDCFHGDDSSKLLKLLFSLLQVCPRAQYVSRRGKLLLSLSIGQTVELHGLSELYRQHLKSDDGCDPIVSEWAAAAHSSKDCLDALDVVSPKILSSTSPAMGEIHAVLAQFAAGQAVRPSPVRKIKPIPVFSSHFSLVKPKTKAEEQLEEAFFKSQPSYLKQLCDVVATRLSSVLEQMCKEEVIPDAVLSGLQQMARWCGQKIRERANPEEGSETRYDTDFLTQPEAAGVLSLAVHRSTLEAHTGVVEQSERYFGSSALSTFEVLCDRNIPPAVLDMAVKVCVSWAKERLNRWIQSSLTGSIHQQLQQSFERMKRVLVGGAKGRGTFAVSEPSRLFIAGRQASAVEARECSLLDHNKDASSHGWSRLDQMQSTPSSWREGDSVIQERPLSSTPLVEPTTPNTGPGPYSHSVHAESVSSLADSFLVGRGEGVSVSVTGVHSRVRMALQDLKEVVCEVDRGVSEGPASRGGLSHLRCVLAELLEGLLCDTTVEGILVPPLLSSRVGCKVATLTVNTAVILITKGCADGDHVCVGAALLVDIWRLLKACKNPTDWQHLLSDEAFESYLAVKHMTAVWSSLGCFLTHLVRTGIVATPELEGLWMAVVKQDAAKNKSCSIEAATVFLNIYNDQDLGPSSEEGANPLHQTGEPLQSLAVVAEDPAKSISPLHIHFIRLLCHLHSHHSLLHTDDGCSCPVVLSPHLVSLAKRLEPIILPY